MDRMNLMLSFDELSVPKGEGTQTFLVTFLSCWLCLVIILVGYAVPSMEGGQAYYLSLAILASIYKGLSELWHSAHLGRKRVSSNPRMPKFSGFSQAKSSYLDGNFAIGHQNRETLIDNGQLSRADFGYFSSICLSYVCCRCEDSFITEHHCPHRFNRQFSFLQDIQQT
ncbi:hypothetical protein Cgig2_019160 [Carnegiea gigantea]|uniref:Uncharacterized protein n=1 Tax=Carnegiea gigantea TaxID=171969 RepID=A0A9Q1GLY1_9CARY|nr:hypothetical protein Cgig2_019160 [Carnegiea gigantea]